MKKLLVVVVSLLANILLLRGQPSQPQCGKDAGGAVCPDGLCCSQWGFCGTTEPWCGSGCQSGPCWTSPPPPPPPSPPPPSPPPPSPPPPSPPPPSPPPPSVQCGKDAGGAICPNGLCCSQWGFCGSTEPWCGSGCQSGPCWTSTPPPPPLPPSSPSPPPPPATPSPPGEDITDLISSSLFEKMLPYRNDFACPARGFYTYDSFITAARSFPAFATTGNTTTRKRELAAFFAQTSHETTGGWATAPGGPFAWGYCFVNEVAGGEYCDRTFTQWPCAPGKQYHGRGPIQLSWNYNYGPCGVALGEDLLNNPDLVASDPVIAFKTALWFWMTPQAPKPSCHDVIIGNWIPSAADIAGNRLPGFGVTTNIINGGLECGMGANAQMLNRIGFYQRYCSSEFFDVSPGDHLDCATQRSFAFGLLLFNTM